jgi:hypothetical protein
MSPYTLHHVEISIEGDRDRDFILSVLEGYVVFDNLVARILRESLGETGHHLLREDIPLTREEQKVLMRLHDDLVVRRRSWVTPTTSYVTSQDVDDGMTHLLRAVKDATRD